MTVRWNMFCRDIEKNVDKTAIAVYTEYTQKLQRR